VIEFATGYGLLSSILIGFGANGARWLGNARMGVEVRTSVFFSRLHPINRLTKRVGSSLRSGGTRIAILASLAAVGGGSRCTAAVLARRVEDRSRNRAEIRNRNLSV
jgi:hypothetical protein